MFYTSTKDAFTDDILEITRSFPTGGNLYGPNVVSFDVEQIVQYPEIPLVLYISNKSYLSVVTMSYEIFLVN